MLTFPKRAVLVVKHPLPEWAPLLKRAVALVAETGSEAGHLATIAQGIRPAGPAGDQASERLQDDETITVDAGLHTIYRGRIEELLRQPPTP